MISTWKLFVDLYFRPPLKIHHLQRRTRSISPKIFSSILHWEGVGARQKLPRCRRTPLLTGRHQKTDVMWSPSGGQKPARPAPLTSVLLKTEMSFSQKQEVKEGELAESDTARRLCSVCAAAPRSSSDL